jgi:hypothetical protein
LGLETGYSEENAGTNQPILGELPSSKILEEEEQPVKEQRKKQSTEKSEN